MLLDNFTDNEQLTTLLSDQNITVNRADVLQATAPFFTYHIDLISTGGILPAAQIIKGDIKSAENDIIHVIDQVLIPSSILNDH